MERLNASRSPVFYGFLLAFECLMWGVSNSVSKLGFSSISPMWCLALRYALSTLLFLAAFGKRFFTRVRKKDLLPCTLVSLATASAFIFGFLSLVYTTATSAGFLMALAVVIAPFLSIPLLKEKLDARNLVPVAIVVVGMYCICGGTFSSFGRGELFAVLSSLSTSFMLTLSGKFLKDTDAIVLCTIQCAVCFLCSLFAAFLLEGMPSFGEIAPAGWWLVLYLALGCTFLAYLFQNIALMHVSPAFAALTWCTEPLFTAISAYFILHERMDFLACCGALLILAGTVFASMLELKKAKPAAPAEPVGSENAVSH